MGSNYLNLPGTSGNYASVPHAADLNITGDFDVRAGLAMDDWTPATEARIVCRAAAATTRALILAVASSPAGRLRLYWSTDGATVVNKDSTVAPAVADRGTLYIRATLDVDNGASGNTVTFYTSPDGTTWTQLGSPVVTAGVTSVASVTQPLEFGSGTNGTANLWSGKMFLGELRNGIDGTIVRSADFTSAPAGATSFTESSASAATVTINGAASVRSSPSGNAAVVALLFD